MAMICSLPRRRTPALGLALGVAIVLSAISTGGALGQGAPWCANTGGRGSAWDCGYYTFEQCMATARGLSSNCAPNPRYIDRQARKRRVPR